MSKPGDLRKTAAWQRIRARVLIEETMCAMCDQVVDKTLPPRSPWAPSVDHITPLHDGGAALDRANARLVHVRCNSARGNRTRSLARRPRTVTFTSRRW